MRSKLVSKSQICAIGIFVAYVSRPMHELEGREWRLRRRSRVHRSSRYRSPVSPRLHGESNNRNHATKPNSRRAPPTQQSSSRSWTWSTVRRMSLCARLRMLVDKLTNPMCGGPRCGKASLDQAAVIFVSSIQHYWCRGVTLSEGVSELTRRARYLVNQRDSQVRPLASRHRMSRTPPIS